MIKLTDTLFTNESPNVADLKTRMRFRFYKDTALFWCSENGSRFSLLDGDMVIHLSDRENVEEVLAFLNMLSPKTAFLSEGDAKRLSLSGETAICVKFSGEIKPPDVAGDRLKSDEIYKLLNVNGLSLPDYPYFATDFCRRLNGGGLVYYALREKAAAIAFTEGDYALINGIASHEKGFGTTVLFGVLAAADKKAAFALCKPKVLPFYLKNGFFETDRYVYCRL